MDNIRYPGVLDDQTQFDHELPRELQIPNAAAVTSSRLKCQSPAWGMTIAARFSAIVGVVRRTATSGTGAQRLFRIQVVVIPQRVRIAEG